MNTSGGEYIHGTDATERRRLSLLNDLMNESSLRAMGLRGGERVLDVGSGLGQLTAAIAKAVGPRGTVVGVERDPVQIDAARRATRGIRNVEFRRGDALGLALGEREEGTFDVVHARFLLEHVPDPQAVVRAMVRAVRVGGRVVLEDDDHDVLRMWPEPKGVYDAWHAYIEAFKVLGNDPYVGRRLVSLLHAAGARPLSNRWNFFGSCSGNKSFAGFVENFMGVLQGARETVLARTSFEAARFDEAIAALEEWGARPDAALWYCTHWAEGERAEGTS